MKHYLADSTWTLIFKKGEPFIETLTNFCTEQRITAGSFHGLGGVLSAEIGYYYLDKKAYESRTLDEVLEVVSLHGNVALKDGAPFIHAHGVLSDAELRTYGGHIKEMVTGGTIELQLRVVDAQWRRELDEETGLGLIALPS